MSVRPTGQAPDRKEFLIAGFVFGVLLLFHAWGATVGWKNLNLPGCEFRQTQTAISAFFIQKDHDFSLAYPTPVLGKPWSIPMEFPLYQWTVVELSNTTGMPLTQAGRAVSLGCFYLTLPALYLLLGRVGLPRSRRLVALGMVVCCPLYVFYARAFLIETMAWMFGVWFLLAYVRAVERRNLAWLLLAASMGAGAGLVKVTTFLFFLMPAFLWTLVWFWQSRPGQPGGGWTTWLRVAGWALAAVAAGCFASVWWVRYSDAIKLLNPAGAFLTSEGLRTYNFGVGVRFDPAMWQPHWIILFREIIWAPVLIGAGLLLAIFGRRWWGMIALLVFFFFAVQVLHPILYAWHEYYYVACAFMLMLAVGLVLVGLLESRLPRLAVWLLIGLAYAGQIGVYCRYYYPAIKEWSPGGSMLSVALKYITDPDDVLIMAGDDWNSMLPYYAQRRSYMIRRNLERTWDLFDRTLPKLRDESVTVFIVYREQRQNQDLITLITRTFGLNPQPVFTWEDAAVYLHEDLRLEAIKTLRDLKMEGIHLSEQTLAEPDRLLGREVEVAMIPMRMRRFFKHLTPAPWKYYTTFGVGLVSEGTGEMLTAHPDTRLWFKAPAGAHSVSVECLITPGAYADTLQPNERTDGVEFGIHLEQPDGTWRTLAVRFLNPAEQARDRGVQKLEFHGEIPEGANVIVTTGPGPQGNYGRDWASLGRIEIK